MSKPPETRTTDVARSHTVVLLGREVIDQLHREIRWLDWLTLVCLPVILIGISTVLSTHPVGLLWFLCLILQGFVLMNLGLVHHDLIMHRHVARGAAGRLIGRLLLTPLYRSQAYYKAWHGAHHRYLDTRADTEQFKIDIDARWRRVLYATAIGALSTNLVSKPRPGSEVRILPDNVGPLDELRMEVAAVRLFTVGWVALAFAAPNWVLLGYVLPLLTIASLANTIRTVLEHSDFDPKNPFQSGCFYRSGWISWILFFFDAGDCHVVHHVFPCIPFYRIPQALRLMCGEFLSQGVREYRSVWPLVAEWFRSDSPYLTKANGATSRQAQPD